MYAVRSIKNKREYMEDRYAVITRGDVTVGMICDGHCGATVADTMSANLPFVLLHTTLATIATATTPIAATTTTTAAMTPTTRAARVDAHGLANILSRAIMKYCETLATARSGSTLTGFVATPSTVFFYNLGDSRTCVHFRASNGGTIHYLAEPPLPAGSAPNAVPTPAHLPRTAHSRHVTSLYWNTDDHAPNVPEEIERVEREGGRFSYGRLNGILAMTRSVGDGGVGRGLGRVPSIYWVARSTICPAILLYSDGLYENGSSTAHRLYHIAIERGLDDVVQHAIESGSEDNITAVVVDLASAAALSEPKAILDRARPVGSGLGGRSK